jgi:hypothetical protein
MSAHFKRILLYFFLIILPELSTAISVDSLSACSESLRASVISQARYTAEDQFLPQSPYAVTKQVSGYEDLDKANDVPQFSEEVRMAFLVYADSGKLFYRDGTPVHITNEELRTQLKLFADFNGGKVDDEMAEDIGLIYVMDKLGQIYIQRFDILSPDWDLYHSSFLAGGPVAAAGMIVVRKGRVVRINDYSGHYRPQTKHFHQLLAQLRRMGVDIDFEQVFSASDPASSRENAGQILLEIANPDAS